MQLGIKISLDNWKENLDKSQTKLCEVWFRLDWEEKYQEMFSYLQKNQIKTGLHFWGVCADNISPNLLTSNSVVRKQSISLMKKTIDIASKYGFYYLNVHPESRELFRLLFPQGKVELLEERTSDEEGKKYLSESAQILTKYGKKKNILFIIETVPRLVPAIWWPESKNNLLINTGTIPSSWLSKTGETKTAINLDIGHTLSESFSPDPQEQIRELINKTKLLAPYIKLMHLTTNIPPFRGVDTHNGFENPDYRQKAIPVLSDLKAIIKIVLKHNPDLLLIPEPKSHHLENYFLLQELIKSI